MSDFFLIAKIASVYGKNGFVKIITFSSFPDRFQKLGKVFIDFFDDKKEFFVEKVIKQKDFFILKFKNFDNDGDVTVLVGKKIFVDENNLVKLPEGYYFIHDMIGCRVFRNETEFGTLKDVLNFPSNDVYVIESAEGNEILIPAVADYVEGFDQDKKILLLKPGEDIYEDDED
ncbi:MAG TPA: ribosome maturation factor RimM [Ignavibacteriaceae bacterium]|nr:ribosome maturation factor RimM [Ignavibacteriaceae bacterium]